MVSGYEIADDVKTLCSTVRCRLTNTKRPAGEAIAPDCPLVPVPPHGRLIDADELTALVYANIALFDSAPERMGAEQKLVRAWLASMVDDIENAPTIIPAEEGET